MVGCGGVVDWCVCLWLNNRLFVLKIKWRVSWCLGGFVDVVVVMGLVCVFEFGVN